MGTLGKKSLIGLIGRDSNNDQTPIDLFHGTLFGRQSGKFGLREDKNVERSGSGEGALESFYPRPAKAKL
jgi:hypothetical protein